MNRAVYSSKPFKQTVHFTPDPWGDDAWFPKFYNDTMPTSREVYGDVEPVSYDTGLLDRLGNPIIKTIWKNGIGFHAEIDED